MKAKINVELYNEDKSNYAPVFPIDPEDKRACRGTRRRRFATWQPLMGYGSSPAFTFRDVVYTGGSIDTYLGYRPVWCVPADSLGQLVAERAQCVPNHREMLCFFETDDYFQIDTPRWYRFDKARRIRLRISSAPRRMNGAPNISSGRFPPTRSYLTLCHPMGQGNRAPSAVCRRKSVPRSCCSTGNILRRAGKSWGQRWRTGISSCGSICSTRG